MHYSMDTTYSLKLPPKNYRRIIEELSVVIPDPVLKLKFLKQAINEHQKISAPYKLYPPIAGIAFRKKLLDNAEQLWPGSKKAARNLIRKGVVSAPHIKLLWLYKLRYAIGSAILMFFILGVGTALSPLVGSFNLGALIKLNSQQVKTANTKTIIRKPIFYSQRPRSGDSPNSSIVKPAKHQNEPELVLKYFHNPILMALASQETLNSPSDRIAQKSLLSSPPHSSGNHPTLATIRPAKHQNEPERVLKYFTNPILMALTSQETINFTSEPISQKPLLSSQPQNSGNHPPSSIIKSEIHQNEPELVLKYFQNPVLMALTTQQTMNSTSDRISPKTLLSAQPHNRGNNPALAIIEPAKHQNEPELVLNYFHSPILIALNSQSAIDSNSDSTSQKTIFSSLPYNSMDSPTSSKVKPVNYQNGVDQFTKYLQNPILMALNSQSARNSNSDRTSKKTLLSTQPRNRGNHPTASTVKSVKFQTGPEQVLKCLQNPILIALISQPAKNSKSDRTIEKTMLSSQPHKSEDQSHSYIVKPVKHQNRSGQVAEYLQNPILMALTHQQHRFRTGSYHPKAATVFPDARKREPIAFTCCQNCKI